MILQSSWHVLIKATPPAPDTSLGSAETLVTYRGGRNHFSEPKANIDLLINYLRGSCQNRRRRARGWGGGVAEKLWEEVVVAQLTLQRVRADMFR